ncbi:MAG: glycosidase, partial [bacterium]
DSALLSTKINGNYMILHRVGLTICADFVKTLDFTVEKIIRCIEVMKPRPGMWDGRKIGIAAPPIKTKKGWLLIYHGISERGFYRVGAALLDPKDPTKVISRMTDALMGPEMKYEIDGQIPNVVFPCGIIVRKDTLFIYYGGADSVTGVATVQLSKLLKVLS